MGLLLFLLRPSLSLGAFVSIFLAFHWLSSLSLSLLVSRTLFVMYLYNRLSGGRSTDVPIYVSVWARRLKRIFSFLASCLCLYGKRRRKDV